MPVPPRDRLEPPAGHAAVGVDGRSLKKQLSKLFLFMTASAIVGGAFLEPFGGILAGSYKPN
ncbi:MAG: hypothetical protein SGPRY_010342 [Prymnesium sp.]